MNLEEYIENESKVRREHDEWERKLYNSFRWVKPVLLTLLSLGIGSIIISMVAGG